MNQILSFLGICFLPDDLVLEICLPLDYAFTIFLKAINGNRRLGISQILHDRMISKESLIL